MSSSQPKLLDQVRALLRSKHYSQRTEQSYVDWITRYVRFHQLRHPRELGATDIAAFLTHLAVDLEVAAATQNQARSALLFLYRQVLGISMDSPREIVAAKAPRRLPVVLTRDEVRAVLAHLDGIHLLMAQLLYGSGLRLMECVRLRVKDIEFAQQQLTVRDGKGMRDRVTMLPDSLAQPLHSHLGSVRHIYEDDLERGYSAVYLPFALERKFPNANHEWGWQYVFPAERLSTDLAARGLVIISGMARGIDTASHRGAIAAKGKTVAVLGHTDVRTTMIYTHVLNRGGRGVRSPLDS